MNQPTIIIMGSAGSGKGTQGQLLEEQLGYEIVEAGAIFRKTALMDTELGRKVKHINDSGGHADDELITELMREHMKDLSSETSLLIDGYPRTMGQADRLEALLKDSGHNPENIVAVWINVPREETERRLLNRSQCTVCKTVFMTREVTQCPHCNGEVKPRDYDKPEAIKKRLDFFDEKSKPVIEYYREQGKLIDVNGEQEVAHVFEEIKEKLKPYIK